MKTLGQSLFSIGILLWVTLCCFDTARAQSSLKADPSQLTFNTQPGVVTPPQTVLLTSSPSASVTVNPAVNWLTVSPSSGTTPLSLTVSVNSNAPTSGSTSGFINLSSPAGFVVVLVILNANSSGGPSPLTAMPNSLSFSFPPNSTVPSSQNVSISSTSSSVTTFTATGATSNGGNWLGVSPSSGSVPGSVQVTVNPVGLGAGTFNAAVAINAPGTNGITVPVLVTIPGTPALDVSPAQLSFEFQIGTSSPLVQTLSLASSTGSNVSFTASAKTTTCGSNWLVLSQTSGATPASLSVQVNTPGLSAGQCSGEIDIAAPSASNPSIAVPVSLLVSTNPLLQAPSTGPTFNYQIGASIPAAQNVQITSSTAGLSFTASAAPASNGPAFLQLNPTSGTTPQAIALSLNPSVLTSLGPGTYTENVTIASAAAGNSPKTFAVTLVVSSNAILTANIPALNFNFEIGKSQPPNQTVTISSTGAPLNYQVSANTTNCSGFLDVSPASGSTFGSQNQVVVSVDTGGLTPQTCSGNVTLTVPGTSTPPLVIPATLNVSNTALLNVSQAAINVTAVAGSATAVQQIVSVTSTDPNDQLGFQATAATNPIGLTWLSVTPQTGNTPNNLQVTINPSNLAVGTYTGTITISSTTSDAFPAQIVTVTLTIASSSISASPTSLTFTQSTGGSALPSQTVQISGTPAGATVGVVATILNGSSWLSASVSGGTVTVNANGSSLPLGTYSGVVTVIVPGAQNSPLNVPVTLTVGATPQLSVSPASLSFSFQIGLPVSQTAQAVHVTSTGSNIPFSASFSSSPTSCPLCPVSAFVTVTPASGNTPADLAATLNADVVVSLAPGSYSGTIIISSPNIASKTVAVNLIVTAASTPVIASITNGATLQPGPVAPGEIITIFGTNIGPPTPASGTGFEATSSGTVPTTLQGVTVTFNNVKAPLLFVSPTQVNAVVPYEVATSPTADVVVQLNGATSAVFEARVVATSPSIFTLSMTGNGQGAILNQNNSVNSVSNPAARGSVIQIFGTGEGQLVPGVPTGCFTGSTLPLPKPIATPISVTIGGQPATPINYAGEAPTLVCGVIQINATVPVSIGTGSQPIVLTIGSNTNSQQNVIVAVE